MNVQEKEMIANRISAVANIGGEQALCQGCRTSLSARDGLFQ
jgi:hypothetical protein